MNNTRAILFSLVTTTFLTAFPAVAADTWTIDSSHSLAGFSIRHLSISNVRGNFSKITGQAQYNGADLKDAKVEATIDASTVDTRDEKRDSHVKNPDFLDVAKFPVMTFKSTSIKPTKEGFDIIGSLTLHGTTKPVTLHAQKLSQPIKDPFGNTRVGTSATTTINRQDFGITFDPSGAMVGNDVNVQLDIELTKNK